MECPVGKFTALAGALKVSLAEVVGKSTDCVSCVKGDDLAVVVVDAEDEAEEKELAGYTTHKYSTNGASYTSAPAAVGGASIVSLPSRGTMLPDLMVLDHNIPVVTSKTTGGTVTNSTAFASLVHTVELTGKCLVSAFGPAVGTTVT